jgi:low molecular weight phosphotyrosine protein phosphatase
MDAENVEDLQRWRQRALKKALEEGKGEADVGRVAMFGDFGGKKNSRRRPGEEVIDPYYGADDGFEVAYEQMNRFTKGFLEFLEQQKQGAQTA